MSDFPALTKYTRFSGCGAKLGPGVLEKALCGLRQPAYPELMADFSGYEDAGLFRLSDDLALVQTVDFFPPIVDDPFLFGRIAAANALSDVYAMGGRPITALCLSNFSIFPNIFRLFGLAFQQADQLSFDLPLVVRPAEHGNALLGLYIAYFRLGVPAADSRRRSDQDALLDAILALDDERDAVGR